MTQGAPAKVIAACLGCAGFAVAIVAGVYANNPTDSILIAAIVSLIACQLVGLLVGMAGETVVRERLAIISQTRAQAMAKAAEARERPPEVITTSSTP